MNSVYDTIVIGAGPAGSSAASVLAKAGLRICLLDRCFFPRDKACGNLISGYCLSLLDRSLKTSCVIGPVKGARILYKHDFEILHSVPIGVFALRRDFDNQLLEWAVADGAEFLPHCHVVNIQQDATGCQVVLADGRVLRSVTVIGADGALGISVRHVRRGPQPKWKMGIAAVANIPLESFKPEFRLPEGMMELDVASIKGGYGWTFQQGNMQNVGLGCSMLNGVGLKDRFASVIRKKLINPDYNFDIQMHSLPVGGISRHLSRGRVLLAGDAAGVVEPVSGEGIGFAVQSGQLAAGCVIQHLTAGANLQREYKKQFNKHIACRLRPLIFYFVLLNVLRPLFFWLRPEYSRKLFKLQFEAVAGRLHHRDYVWQAVRLLPKLCLQQFLKKPC